MSKSYNTTVNDTFKFVIDNSEMSTLDIIEASKNAYHFLHENQSFHIEIVKSNFNSKMYTVSVNNTTYAIAIEDELDQLIKEMGFSIGSKKTIKSVNAPMPGLILNIDVEVGQSVKENDTLLILEAMKMENSITAPIDGTIKSINAKKGDAVEKNQLIIEFN